MIGKAILEKKIPLPIEVANPNILHKLGLKRKIITFMIPSVTIGALQEVEPLIAEINDPSKITTGADYVDYMVKEITENQASFCKVIALVIYNRKFSNNPITRYFQNKYIKNMTKFFVNNLDGIETFHIVQVVNEQLKYQHHLAAMALLKNLNLSKAQEESPQKGTSSAQ